MKRISFLLSVLMLITIFALSACANEPEDVDDNATTTDEETIEEEPEVTGPIPFSEVNDDMMTASDTYSMFTFEEGTGDCMDQGFPSDMVYDSENVMKTADGSYLEDWTSIDFTGRIRFDELPLETGSAACTMETNTGSDDAKVTCTVDEVEVCTATFKVFAHK